MAEYRPGPQLYSYMGGRERGAESGREREEEREQGGARARTHARRERERGREGQKTCFVAKNTCLSRQNFVATKMILVAAPANDTKHPLPSLSQGPFWFPTTVIQVAQPPFHATDSGGS